jgi:hypothetical protein
MNQAAPEVPPRTYTREEVVAAVKAGADLVNQDGQIGGSDRDMDLIDLVCNAILTLIDEPGMTLDQVIERNWDGQGGQTPVQKVRGWWGGWS